MVLQIDYPFINREVKRAVLPYLIYGPKLYLPKCGWIDGVSLGQSYRIIVIKSDISNLNKMMKPNGKFKATSNQQNDASFWLAKK